MELAKSLRNRHSGFSYHMLFPLMKYKRQCYCAHLANNALHTSHFSKAAVLSNVRI